MFEQDSWLSGTLDMACWRMSTMDARVTANAIRSEMTTCAGNAPAFFFVKRRTDAVSSLPALTQAGFHVVDVGVTLDYVSATPARDPAPCDFEMGEAVAGDEAAIADLSARCFAYSRFHADRLIGVTRANVVKREWARNACRGRAAAVYVAKRAGQVAGFLAVLKSNSDMGTDAVIDLIGVDASHRGQGIGRALSLAFIQDWHARADRLRVGTQAANIPALRLYESLGFRIVETSYALHAHLRKGTALA